MKKPLCALLALALLLALTAAALAESAPAIVEKEMTFYLNDLGDVRTYDVYFMGDSDVPYFSLADWAELMPYLVRTYARAGQNISFDLRFSMEGDPYSASFDCAADTIYFLDYDAFQRPDEDRRLIDILGVDNPRSEEEVKYFQRCAGSYERYGTDLTVDLGAYGIDLVSDGENCYVPIQTLSDFLLALQYMNVYYNGEAFFIVTIGGMGQSAFTPIGERFHAVEAKGRSAAMGEFSYAELCAAMDHLYGLKEAHGFESFDVLAKQAGCDQALSGTDAFLADEALYNIISSHLNDGHSTFVACSPMASGDSITDNLLKMIQKYGYGRSLELILPFNPYLNARAEFYPDGILSYEEVGNTAYITFDHFVEPPEGVNYYQAAPTAEATDTIGVMLYAYDQIMREDSPVENVVLDLSCNTGGASDTAVFVLSAFAGKASISVQNTMTGAIATGVYQVDMNLDRQFDEQDLGLTGKNLYCLISPYSFSCGNLVPNVFKNTGAVVLLGRTSGGGSCAMLPLSTAYGTDFRISSPWRLAFAQNGSFYDIDRGVDPDFCLAKIASFYDREGLAEYINALR